MNKQFPLDYVIGSVHFINGIHLFNRERWRGLTEEQILQEKELYYRLIQLSARSRTFDFPTDDMLERIYHYGIKVTFGSDAHSPGHVGDDWQAVRRKLKEIGYKEWVYFSLRNRKSVSL
jgi:histidinol-phosphatase (PHP family)